LIKCDPRILPEKLSKDYLKNNLKEVMNSMTYNFQDKSQYQIRPNIMGFDTETYASNGDILTLCLSDGNHIEFKNGEFDFQKIFDFFQPYIRQKVLFFAWNLGFDAMILLKNLGKNIEQLKKEEYKFSFKKFNIHYIPKKSLSISDKKKHSLIFYDVASLFNKQPLDKVSKKFLGKQKEYNGKYQNKKFPDNILKNEKELNLIIEYCILDSQLTKQLTEFWIDKFYESFGIYPKKYHSAGTIAMQYIHTKLSKWSSFFMIPYNIQELAYKSYFGGRFEVLKRGTFSNVYHYDINSAYPYAMSILPDFTEGTWHEVKNISGFDKSNLKYFGFYQIDVQVNENTVSPFLYRPEKELSIFMPNGKFTTFTTSRELKVSLEKFDVNLLKIKGYYFIPNENKSNQFNKIIKEMYKSRLDQKDEGQKHVYKIIINSIYGKTAQAKPVPTSFFSPVVTASITGICRSMLLEAVSKNKDDIIAFATDGIFSTKPLNLKVSKDKKLGYWSFEFHRDFTIFMSGIYSFNYFDHKSKKWNRATRSRGFKIKCIKDNGETYMLDLDDSMIHYDKEKSKFYLKIKYILPNTISASIIQNKIRDIGKMEIKEKEINLNGDSKRFWLHEIKNLKSIQNSSCLDVEFIG
jgi:hypothetical protein